VRIIDHLRIDDENTMLIQHRTSLGDEVIEALLTQEV
jgi:hypothetical protein